MPIEFVFGKSHYMTLRNTSLVLAPYTIEGVPDEHYRSLKFPHATSNTLLRIAVKVPCPQWLKRMGVGMHLHNAHLYI